MNRSVCTRHLRCLASLLVLGCFLSFFPVRELRAASGGSQNAAEVSATVPQPQSAQMQAKRREQIHQKKIDNPEAGEESNVYRHSATVHAIARIFGLSVESTSRLFETINFAVLVILLVWIVARLLPKTLRNRTERIRNELEQARVATAEANRRLADVERRLGQLDSEIEGIRTRAEQETILEEKHLRAALEQEKQSILENASQDIQAATKNAQSLLKNLAADLVIEHARKKIAVTPETDRSLVEGFVSDLERNQPRGGAN